MDKSSWYRRPDWAGHFHSGQPQAGAGVAIRNLPSGPIFETLPVAVRVPLPKLFRIYDASVRNASGVITSARIRLVESLLCGEVPTTDLTAIAAADNDKVYAHVEYDTETGEVTGRTISTADTVPSPSEGNAYLLIGSVDISADNKALTPVNDIYGPIIGCRNWFVTPLTYTLYGTGP